MSGAALIEAARAAGVVLAIEGDLLVIEWEEGRPPPPALIDALRTGKGAVVDSLRAQPPQPPSAWSGVASPLDADPAWTVARRREARVEALTRFAEAFHTFAGRHIADGADRMDADRRAIASVAAEWRVRRPPLPAGGIHQCAQCGLRGHGDCVPFLAAHEGHVWLHRECWQAWDAVRTGDAQRFVMALLREAGAAGLTDADTDALEALP